MNRTALALKAQQEAKVVTTNFDSDEYAKEKLLTALNKYKDAYDALSIKSQKTIDDMLEILLPQFGIDADSFNV